MTGIQGSVGGLDVIGPLRPCDADPLAALLARRQARRDAAPCPDLRRAAQRDVVPRLYDRFSGLAQPAARAVVDQPCERVDHLIAAFANELLARDPQSALSRLESSFGESRAIDWFVLNILEPTAWRLDAMWRDDLCGLAEAALAMQGLMAVLRDLAPAFRAGNAASRAGHRHYRALFLAAPSSKTGIGAELFGLALASECLRREGWDAAVDRGISARGMGEAMRNEWFDTVMIGPCERQHLDAVAAGIRNIRRASRNKALGIILHGRIFAGNPDLIRQVDADYVSPDAQTSLIQAKLYTRLPPPCQRLR